MRGLPEALVAVAFIVLSTAALAFLVPTRGAPLHVAGVEVFAVERLSPVDIGHAVPTGFLRAHDVLLLNLPVWAGNVTRACIASFGAATDPPSAHLHSISEMVQSQVDPDFAVHACIVDETGSCSTGASPTEDKNRFIDLRVAFNGASESGVVRITVAEDAAKAVNFPLSFDVVVNSLRDEGRPVKLACLSRNLSKLALTPS